MTSFTKRVMVCLALLTLAACAAGPKFDAKDVDETLTPQRAAANAEQVQGNHVIWGGVILSTSNLKDTTQVEVLAYPISRSFRPDSDATPLGRFLIVKQGYIETADYSVGRSISVSGTLSGTQEGKIGEVNYAYPVIQAAEIYLWPRDSAKRDSNVHFGFGLGIIR